MKIAICDWAAETSKDIEDELKQKQYVSKVETYTNIDLFCNMLSMGQVYDVVFMEIDWKQKKQELISGRNYKFMILKPA